MIKKALTEYYESIRYDFDEEEIEQVLQILSEYDDNLSGLSEIDKTILLRMVDPTTEEERGLYDSVDKIGSHDDGI